MAKKIDLFAAPEELVFWASAWAEEFSLCVAAIWIRPELRVQTLGPDAKSTWRQIAQDLMAPD